MRKICAVIVTYNRPELLCRCVKKLLDQDYPLDILIYDNHSSFDTKSALEEQHLIRDNVIYFYADENTGGSGGFYNGMKMASERDYDDLVLMDDDGYAINSHTLSELVRGREKVGENAIVNSLVVCDEESLQLSFSMNRSYDGKKIQSEATDGLLKDVINPFNGTLVSANVIRKIGFPKKEFFVYGDESEYYHRARHYGVDCFTAVDSLYYHPTNIGDMKRVFGFNLAIGDVPMWKVYCSSRNCTYYIHQYFGKAALIKSIIRSYANVVFCNKRRLERFRYTTAGIKDGLKGDFSKQLDLTK